MDFSSKLLENAVNEVSRLPGIGETHGIAVGVAFVKATPRAYEVFNRSLKRFEKRSENLPQMPQYFRYGAL